MARKFVTLENLSILDLALSGGKGNNNNNRVCLTYCGNSF